MNSKLESISALRLTFIAVRTKLELKDNPRLHLNPCEVCGTVLTRFSTCASCELKSNGHLNI